MSKNGQEKIEMTSRNKLRYLKGNHVRERGQIKRNADERQEYQQGLFLGNQNKKRCNNNTNFIKF